MNLENMVESGDAIAMDLFLKAMQYRCFLDTRFCNYLDLTIVDDVDQCLGFLLRLLFGVHGSRYFYGFS